MSPRSLPQSSAGRFEVSSVETRSWRRMSRSSSSSAAVVANWACSCRVRRSRRRPRGESAHASLPERSSVASASFSRGDVGFAVAEAVALLDRGERVRLREMALAGAGRAEEHPVLAALDVARRREFVGDQAVGLLVEVQVEPVERLACVAAAGLPDPTAEQPVLTPEFLVAEEHGREVDVGLALGRRRGCGSRARRYASCSAQ